MNKFLAYLWERRGLMCLKLVLKGVIFTSSCGVLMTLPRVRLDSGQENAYC